MPYYGMALSNAERQRRWRERNPDKIPRRRYGMSQIEYTELMQTPCALCGAPSDHLDHCHKTGKVRAPLCRNHNTGLGKFQDDPVLLERAAAYLREHA